jgi:hypothetical protein
MALASARASADHLRRRFQMTSEMKMQTSWLMTAIAVGLPLGAMAQASPADPASAAPSLRYQSVFSDYKAWQDIQPGNWRAINDSLRGTPGGHAAYGTAPAGAPAPTRPASSAPAAGQQAPAQPGHGGHHMHGGQE